MKKTNKSNRFESFMYTLFAPLLRVFLRVKIHGKENIPTEGGCVVAVNHIAFLDVMAVSCVFPRRRLPRYLAKAELFRIPVLRGVIRGLGAIPLDRHGSDVGAVRRAIAIAESGELLTLFPQGTRQKGKNPADTPIKSGVAMIASHARVPILPVCIKLKGERYRFLRRTEVIVGKPIPPEALGLLSDEPNYREAAAVAFRAVCELGGYTPSALTEEERQ